MTKMPLRKLSPRDGLDDSGLLRKLVDSLPDQVYVKDTEGRYLLSNHEHAKVLGAASPEEIAGSTDSDFYPRHLVERYRADEQEVVESGLSLVDKEEPSVDEEGNERWHSSTKVPLRDSSGDIVGLAGLTRDITDRKWAEEALRKSEVNLAEAQQMARLGSWEWDTKTGEVFWSDEVFRIYGFAPEEFVPTVDKLMEAVHPDDQDLVVKRIQAALRQNEPYDFEHRIVRPNGEVRVVHRQAEVVFDEEGEPLRMVGAVHDITERKRTEEALKESEERYRAVMEQSVEAIWLFDPDTKEVLESNTAFQKLLEYTAEDLKEMTNYDFVAHSREDIDSAIQRIVGEGKGFFGERKYRRKDGTLLDVEVSGSVTSYQSKKVVCAVARDLTKRKEAEEALKESEERFRTAFEDAPIGVALVGLDRSHLRVNHAYCKMLGYTEEELLAKPHPEIIHPDDHEESAERIQGILDQGVEPYALQRRYFHSDGHEVWSLSNISLIRDSEGKPRHFVCLHQDITERKALEERLEHQAFYDALTDLPNRVLVLDRLKHALARTSREDGPVAVLLLDLDNFKVVNDSLGHDAGNALLIDLAVRLEVSVRPGDTVGRIFGDEFAVLLEAPAGIEEARRVVERIEESLQTPFDVEGREVYLSASIGIALSETAEDSAAEVLQHADLAMYEAKARGKTQHEVYNSGLNARAVERLDLENALRRAIDREEFEVHYQPTIELSAGTIVGFEALARWRHPERGLVVAGEFIELAEETGMIRPIGRLVVQEACRQAQEWRERYPNKALLMQVNLSANQFSNQPDMIPAVLEHTGLDPQGLQLEITERAVMDDAEYSIERLRKLKDRGVGLAIDDYGMGYSCLYYLKRMPVDSLKIDRSFVEGLGEDPGDEAIVSGTIGLAHALGLKVVAEGVETEEQLAKLKELGCDLAQGYYLAKPLSSEGAERLLKEGSSC